MNKKNAIRILAISLAFAFSPHHLNAQNIIYELPNYSVKNSIIRHFEGEKSYVIYTDDGIQRKFTYITPSAYTVTTADFTSAGVNVYDMKIVDKSLYFCGETTSGGIAVFGFFDIYQTFFGSAPIYVSYVNAYAINLPNGTPANEQLKKLLQIEVLKFADNDIHICMIADADYSAGNTVSNNYRCVVDVWETGVGGGTAHSDAELSGVYYYNDLTITDSNLVVVGDKHGGTGQYMHQYSPLLAGSSTILLTSSLPIYWFAPDNEYYPVPEVRVTHIHDDYFAVACNGVIHSADKGIVVSVYQGAGNLVDRIIIQDHYDTRQLRDLECRYDKVKSLLYLIPEYDMTNKRNSQYVIDLSPTFMMTGVSLQTPIIDEVHSMTLNNHETAISGMSSGELHVWETDIPTNQCIQAVNVPFYHHWFVEPYSTYENNISPWKYYYSIFFPVVSPNNIDTLCK